MRKLRLRFLISQIYKANNIQRFSIIHLFKLLKTWFSTHTVKYYAAVKIIFIKIFDIKLSKKECKITHFWIWKKCKKILGGYIMHYSQVMGIKWLFSALWWFFCIFHFFSTSLHSFYKKKLLKCQLNMIELFFLKGRHTI